MPNGGKYARAISEPGRQYAIYMHHGKSAAPWGWGMCYEVERGDFRAELTLALPHGKYTVEWVNPADLATLRTVTFDHPGGETVLSSPGYAVDIALRILAA